MSIGIAANVHNQDLRVRNSFGHELEVSLDGEGAPVTVLAHSSVGSIKECRQYGSGILGTKAAFHFPGYGGSSHPDSALSIDAAADSVRAVAARTGATRAVGVSLGACAILRAMTEDQGLFTEVALILPFTFDAPAPPAVRQRYDYAVTRGMIGDLRAAISLIRPSLPPGPRFDKIADRVARDAMGRGTLRLLSAVSTFVPVPDHSALSALTARVLVIGHPQDPFHSLDVAAQVCAAIPSAELHLAAPRSALADRATVAQRIAQFFNSPNELRPP